LPHHRARGKSWVLAACPLAIAAVALGGCHKADSSHVDLWGQVTWKGRPVPAGYLVFTPDAKKGNSGSQGSAAIVDGKYDTREASGRPAVRGPIVATVNGFDGINAGEDRPRGSRLFLPCELPVVAPNASGELNLQVPVAATPLRASS
jgi:hypothetical protein